MGNCYQSARTALYFLCLAPPMEETVKRHLVCQISRAAYPFIKETGLDLAPMSLVKLQERNRSSCLVDRCPNTIISLVSAICLERLQIRRMQFWRRATLEMTEP